MKFDTKNMTKLRFIIFFQFENNPLHPPSFGVSKVHPGKAQQYLKCSSYIRFIQYVGLITDCSPKIMKDIVIDF